MATPRFYTPEATFLVGKRAYLTEAARHHAGRVLRMVAGDRAILFNGCGAIATGPIAFEGADAYITVTSIDRPQTESPLEITLLQSLISLEKLDWVIEKSVEIGVKHLIVTPAKHSVVRLVGDRLEKRLTHWKDLIVSACEQSGRVMLPTIAFMPLETALQEIRAEQRYVLALSSNSVPRLSGLSSVAFAIGPEGGFSGDEIHLAEAFGWKSALIGPRVLRTETAGLVAATLANAASGDMGLA